MIPLIKKKKNYIFQILQGFVYNYFIFFINKLWMSKKPQKHELIYFIWLKLEKKKVYVNIYGTQNNELIE